MLFMKKKVKAVSVLDTIPQESKDKLIEDTISIVRTLANWPKLIPVELHASIGAEIVTLLRSNAMKLASSFMSIGSGIGSESDQALAEAFKGVQLPNLISQMFHAVKLATEPEVPPTVTWVKCPHGLMIDQCPNCQAPEDDNGTAA